jgi:hypothetical protein
MGNEKIMDKPSRCRAPSRAISTEKRLLKEIEELKQEDRRIELNHHYARLSQHRETKKNVYEDFKELIENWWIMLDTPEYDDEDAGLVRDEMKQYLSQLNKKLEKQDASLGEKK